MPWGVISPGTSTHSLYSHGRTQEALAATAFQKNGVTHACSFLTLATIAAAIDRMVTEELPRICPLLANVRGLRCAWAGRSRALCIQPIVLWRRPGSAVMS